MDIVMRVVDKLANIGWVNYLLVFAALHKVELTREQIDLVLAKHNDSNESLDFIFEDVFEEHPETKIYLPVIIEVLAYNGRIRFPLELISKADESARQNLRTIILEEVVDAMEDENALDPISDVIVILPGQPADLLKRYLAVCMKEGYPKEAQKAAEALGRNLTAEELDSLLATAFESSISVPSEFVFISKLRGAPLTDNEVKRFLQKCVAENTERGLEDVVSFVGELNRPLTEEELAIIEPCIDLE
jgi:hypothetical protein